MMLVLLLALLHVSFLAMLCQATCTISGINVSEEIEDALKVEQLIGINDGQILKSMEGPNCNTAVGVEASLLLMDRKAGASEDCRLPTMQVSFPWLILTIATALVITLLFAVVGVYIYKMGWKKPQGRQPKHRDDGTMAILKKMASISSILLPYTGRDQKTT